MEWYEGRVAVTFRELTEGADPIVKPNTLKTWIHRKRVRYARKGYGEGIAALIVYESLPGKVQEEVRVRIGDPDELRKASEKAALALPEDEEARVFYHYRYRYRKGGMEVGLPEHIADEYTLNARVLLILLARQNHITATSDKLGIRPEKPGKVLLELSEELRRQWGHTLPASERHLLRKLKAYREEGYTALISGKMGNSNTRKITPETGARLVALMRSKDPVYSIEDAWAEYNRRAEKEGLQEIKSVQTVREYLQDPEVRQLWLDAQEGEKRVHAEFGLQLSLLAPSVPNALWAVDGTRFNLFYQNQEGKRSTKDIYYIFDVATGYIVGWKLGKESAEETQKPAFRMALQNSGVRPYEIVMDNQSSQRKLDRAGFFRKVAVHGVRFKTPYRSQANPAEHLIGLVQKQVLRRYPYFTGQNVTAKKASSRPNEEWILANEHHLPTEHELESVAEETVRIWNQMKTDASSGLTREEWYRSGLSASGMKPYTPEEWEEIFYERRDREVAYLNGGLELTVKGVKMSYTAYTTEGKIDTEWHRKNVTRRFGVKYDPLDLSRIAIYRVDRDGGWRFERHLLPTKQVHMAAYDRTERDEALTYSRLGADTEMRIARAAEVMAIDLMTGANAGYETPRVQGLTREQNDEVQTRAYEILEEKGFDPVQVEEERRRARRRNPVHSPKRESLAGLYKTVSQTDWLEGKRRSPIPATREEIERSARDKL